MLILYLKKQWDEIYDRKVHSDDSGRTRSVTRRRGGGFERSKLEEAALIKSGPRRQIEGRSEINQPFVLQP